MCYALSAEKILLNYFAAKPESIEISFEEISNLSCRIVRECQNSIITRISIDDIEYAVTKREETFQLRGASVVVKDKSLFKYIDLLNQAMPDMVAEKCKKVCNDYAEENV
jgi:hypothetical protein